MNTVSYALEEAEVINENVKTIKIETLISRINDYERIENYISEIEGKVRLFFNNDFSLLCFVVDDKGERYKAARFYLELFGETVGKDKAKNWLSEKEQELKKKYKADKIEIIY